MRNEAAKSGNERARRSHRPTIEGTETPAAPRGVLPGQTSTGPLPFPPHGRQSGCFANPFKRPSKESLTEIL